MTTLERLLEDSNSPLIKVDMKEALRPDIFNKLPIDAIESLYDLLPLADLVFLRARPDHSPEDKLEIIQPESIEHINQLKQDPWCAPYISSSVFNNLEFKTAWEDFIVLLSEGYYEPEDEKDGEDEEVEKVTVKGRRKRNANDATVDEDENEFKDDQYERYWGERLEKQQKKQKKRTPKSKKSAQEQEPVNVDDFSIEEEQPMVMESITKEAQPPKKSQGRKPRSKKLVQEQEPPKVDELSNEEESKMVLNTTTRKSVPAKRGRGRPKKQ
ncbi:hypothetical protein INT45_003601 [Circinella minor]|uniref:ASX DEUBAD domain-containing protein n=1 Tax=Circinella minor TaxID=1195481 RepID=A0A8H7VFQ2_9FUNG|nr:hypothetical protein INT45_003601 [Circinella minor]